MHQRMVAALSGAVFLVTTCGFVTVAAAAGACPAGSTCGSMGPSGPAKPVPVGPTTITYPTGKAPKVDPKVYEPRPVTPLPRSPEAQAGRKSYCAKNPFKCGEGG